MIKKIKSCFFSPTPELFKSISYQELPSPAHWEKIADGREIYVEIGSGHGEVLLANNTSKSITIGYEIKSRFFRLTQKKIRKRLDAFVFKGSGYESLVLHYNDESIDRLYILFPDPWHKKRHAHRRPLTATFFNTAAQKIKSGGRIIVATDWTDYADFIKNELSDVNSRYDVQIEAYDPAKFGLPVTHYHQKWQRKGRSFTAFILIKK